MKLVGIAIRNRPRIAMQVIDSAQVSTHSGILGDHRGALPERQVTLLSADAWSRTCTDLNAELPWTLRRANLLIEGVEFNESSIGRILRINAVELVITRETTPCSLMDAQHQGLTGVLRRDWNGGVCCRVARPGHLQVGDQVELI